MCVTQNSPSGVLCGFFSEADNLATSLYGVRGTADTHSSNVGTVATDVYGVYAWAKQRGKGTVTNLYGLYARTDINDASGNITNAYAVRAIYTHYFGTTTNSYGVYIDAVTGATNNYGLVLAGDGVGSDIVFGASQDASIYYDGDDLVISPQLVGTGGVRILNMKSGATQAAAGAATDELWKTNGHATLPDNTVMIGV